MGAIVNKTGKFPWHYDEPPIFEASWFEEFDVVKCRDWMEENWTLSVYAVAIYIPSIFLLQRLMKNRSPFNLKTPLALWNLIIAIFSFYGALRCAQELLYVLSTPGGFHRSLCIRYV